MADYDDRDITLTFPYSDWGKIEECLHKRRLEAHDRADRLEAEGDGKNADQIRGLRRKASDFFELQEDIRDARTEVRQRVATER